MNKIVKATKVKDKDVKYITGEDDNMRYIAKYDAEEARKDQSNHGETTSKKEERENESNDERYLTKKDEKKNDEAPTEDFCIEKIVDHKINSCRRNRYAKVSEPLYKFWWYYYQQDYYYSIIRWKRQSAYLEVRFYRTIVQRNCLFRTALN